MFCFTDSRGLTFDGFRSIMVQFKLHSLRSIPHIANVRYIELVGRKSLLNAILWVKVSTIFVATYNQEQTRKICMR